MLRDEYKSWLKPALSDNTKARYKLCMTTFFTFKHRILKSNADGKKHQTVAGKLHSAQSVTQCIQVKLAKKQKNLKLGIWGNLIPHNCIKLL